MPALGWQISFALLYIDRAFSFNMQLAAKLCAVARPSIRSLPSIYPLTSAQTFLSLPRFGSSGGDDDSLDVVDYRQGVDVAVDFVAGAHGEDVLDAEAAARLRRKLDWHLLPLIFAVYASESDGYWWLASPCRPRAIGSPTT